MPVVGRVGWWLLVGSAALVGLAWVSLVSSTCQVVVQITIVVTLGDAALRELAGTSTHGERLSRATGVAAATVASLAGVGVISALGWAGAWLLALIVVTSPGSARRVTDRLVRMSRNVGRGESVGRSADTEPGPRPSPHQGQVQAPGDRPAPVDSWPHPELDVELLRSIGERELCWLWRSSYLLVARCVDAQQLGNLSLTRRRYLEEIERRDPAGFSQWMLSGARPASDPTRYLTVGHDRSVAGASAPGSGAVPPDAPSV